MDRTGNSMYNFVSQFFGQYSEVRKMFNLCYIIKTLMFVIIACGDSGHDI